jgi:hypothetical protein
MTTWFTLGLQSEQQHLLVLLVPLFPVHWQGLPTSVTIFLLLFELCLSVFAKSLNFVGPSKTSGSQNNIIMIHTG